MRLQFASGVAWWTDWKYECRPAAVTSNPRSLNFVCEVAVRLLETEIFPRWTPRVGDGSKKLALDVLGHVAFRYPFEVWSNIPMMRELSLQNFTMEMLTNLSKQKRFPLLVHCLWWKWTSEVANAWTIWFEVWSAFACNRRTKSCVQRQWRKDTQIFARLQCRNMMMTIVEFPLNTTLGILGYSCLLGVRRHLGRRLVANEVDELYTCLREKKGPPAASNCANFVDI